MVHIPLLRLLPDGVQLLAGGEGVQGCHGQDLGLPPGEEGRAVDPGQHAHLSGQGTDLVLLTAIHPVPLEEPGFDNLLLEFIGDLFQVLIHLGILLQEEFVPVVDEGVPALLPDIFVVGVHGGLGFVHGGGHDLVKELLVEVGVVVGHLLLADLGHNGVDKVHLGLDLLVSLHDGLIHDLVGELVGPGLDHHHLGAGGGHGEVQLGGVLLRLVGVHDDLTIHIAHLQAADGAAPGDVGHRQAGGHAHHGRGLGRAVPVHAHHGAGDHHVVAEVSREEGTDGAVNDPAGQHGGQRGLPLPAHKGAGNPAHGVQLFLKVHGQGEEIHPVSGPGGGGDRHQHGGVAVADHGGGVGQLSHLSKLQGEGAAGNLGLVNVVVELLLGDNG